MNIKINTHSSIQIDDIAFDPYGITEPTLAAKYVCITHTHFDHLDIESIKNISNKNTIIVAPQDAKEPLEQNFSNKIVYVKPNEVLNFEDFTLETFSSYNINKKFHPKANNWVGYKLVKDNKTYVVAGDTDVTPELEKLANIDVLFLPIGGTYTMTATEAAKLANKVKPALVIPMHYGSVVGSKANETEFIKHLNADINYKILL